MKITSTSRREQWDRTNREAAEVILADPVKFPVGSFPELWARLLVRRVQTQATANPAQASPEVRRA